MTALVLFGAGASYDQAGPCLPPLGSQLSSHLARFSRLWRAPDLQRRFEGTDFELAMQRLLGEEAVKAHAGVSWEWKAGSPPPRSIELQWDMAAFFFSLDLATDSQYEQFVKRSARAVESGSLRLATLNYDRLLFQALEHAGVAFDTVGDSTNPHVCMPHGSAALAGPAALRTDGVLEIRTGVELVPLRSGAFMSHGKVSYLSGQVAFEAARQSNQLGPVMSFIEPTKSTPNAENYIRAERRCWSRWVAEAERIALIGVRVREQDRHIWGPLAETEAELLYVGGDGARQFNAWQRTHRPRRGRDAMPLLWQAAVDDVLRFVGAS